MPRRTRAEVEASMAARREEAAQIEQILQIAEDLSTMGTSKIDFVVYPGETPHEVLEEILGSFPSLGGLYTGISDANGHHTAEITGPAEEVEKFVLQYQG